MEHLMNTFSKFILAAVTALTLTSGAVQADDNPRRQGGPGVVISQQHTLGPSLAHDAQGR